MRKQKYRNPRQRLPRRFKLEEVGASVPAEQRHRLMAEATQRLKGVRPHNLAHAAAVMRLKLPEALAYFRSEAAERAAEKGAQGQRASADFVGTQIAARILQFDTHKRLRH